MYKEEEFLQLSGIQHFAFCRRQWALAYIEMQWQENVRTVEGKILHENAHDPAIKEKRGDGLMKDALCARLRSQKVKWFTCIPLLSQTWIPHRNTLSDFTAKEV